MPKKNFNDLSNEKEKLGKFIRKLREEKGISLRKLAEIIGLAAPNLTGIESGKNVPSPEIYLNIIRELNPKETVRREMDVLYSNIRNVPPPDICEILIKNTSLAEKLRILENINLSNDKLVSIGTFFESLKN